MPQQVQVKDQLPTSTDISAPQALVYGEHFQKVF